MSAEITAEGPLISHARIETNGQGVRYVSGIILAKVSHRPDGKRHEHRIMFRSFRAQDIAAVGDMRQGVQVRAWGFPTGRIHMDDGGQAWGMACIMADDKAGEVEVLA